MQIFDLLNKIILVVTSITLIISTINLLLQYRKSKKLDEDISIKIVLKSEDADFKDPPLTSKFLVSTIKRRHFTRSEIQGTLGNAYISEKRYKIPYLKSNEFTNDIALVQNNKEDKITIEIVDKKEYEKFN